MRWLDQRIRRTTAWMASARTPESRARIRRWSRVESIGLVVALAGLALLVVALIATIVVAVWFDLGGIDLADVYRWLWGVAVGVTLVGAITLAVGSRRRLTACYADGYVTTGRIDRVIEQPADDQVWYKFWFSAGFPNGIVLHRIVSGNDNDPSLHIGRLIRFRHNTLDPDDLDDALFDGWPDDARAGQ